MYTPIQIASYILANFDAKEFSITPMKLQKLVYYAYAWSLVADVKLMNDGVFEAWEYGPVSSELYHQFKVYGKNVIDGKEPLDEVAVDANHVPLIDFIVKSYLPFSAITLSKTTHVENPWVKTAVNEPISDELIKEYYVKQDYALNFAEGLDKLPSLIADKPYYAPKTTAFHSFIFDVSKEETELHKNLYPSFNYYLQVNLKQKELVNSFFQKATAVS